MIQNQVIVIFKKKLQFQNITAVSKMKQLEKSKKYTDYFKKVSKSVKTAIILSTRYYHYQ